MRPLILMVTPYLPLQGVHAGGARMLRLLDDLVPDFRFSVLSLDGPPLTRQEAKDARQALRERGLALTAVPFKGSFREHLGREQPSSFTALHSRPMRAALVRALADERPALVQLEYTPSTAWLPLRVGVPLAVTAHQVETLAALRAARAAPRWLARARHLLDAHKALAAESAGLSRADAVFALTPGEQRWIRAMAPKPRLMLAPMGVDRPPAKERPAEIDLVFHGDFSHPPNQQAASVLCREILPAVRAELPGATLSLVGPHPPRELRRLGRRLAIEVTGRVAGLHAALGRGRVYVAPLTRGAGMRGKILDALACGLPVVTTRIGAEGLPLRDGGLCIVESHADTARCAAQLLLDPEERARLGRQGRQTASRFSWARTAGVYREAYRTLLT